MQHPSKRTFKKRGKRWLTAALITALVLAAAFVGLVPVIKERRPGRTAPLEIIQPDFRTLEIRNAEEIAEVTVYPANAQSYTLKMQNGTLKLDKGGELTDLNDLYASELLEVFTQFVAQDTVAPDAEEVEEHLEDMGLSPAKASAVIRYQDGEEAVLEVGDPVPNTSYAYYRWSGDPGIYMCDVGIAEAFALTANHLLPVEQPTVHAALVSELYVRNAAGESRYAFEGIRNGRMTEPFAYPLASASAEQLLSALENFRLGTKEAEITPENRAEYGFENPLCTLEIHQQAGTVNQIGEDGALMSAQVPAQLLRFVIGRAEGDYFYTCEYEGNCYFVSRFLAETLVKSDRDKLLSRNPALEENAQIASLFINAPQGELAVDALRSERVLPNNQLAMDENGNPVYDVLVAVNGREGTQEQLDEMTNRLLNLTVSGKVPEDFQLEQGAQKRWSLAVETTDGQVRQIDAYRMDAFSDVLAVDGVIRHTVHADAIDALIAGLI